MRKYFLHYLRANEMAEISQVKCLLDCVPYIYCDDLVSLSVRQR